MEELADYDDEVNGMLPNREVIDRFREAVAQRFGLQFDNNSRDFLGEVLARRAARSQVSEPLLYVQRLVMGNVSAGELAILVGELTVGETHFFRHPDQFRALAHVIHHDPQSRHARTRRLRILCAGCASGEEAYTLAIVLRQHIPDNFNWDSRIVGVDLNPAALARAFQARYTAWSLRGVSEDSKDLYFRPIDKEYQLGESVRNLVTFEERNLLSDDPGFWQVETYDFIFCRNVLMYFTPEAARTVVARLTRSLVPGGFLFLSPAETLRGLSNEYHLRHTHEAFYYQRRTSAEKPQQPSWSSPPAYRSSDELVQLLNVYDDSWVTVIGEASERIARLGRDFWTPPPTAHSTSNPSSHGAGTPEEKPQIDLVAAREMVRQERFTEALQALGVSTGGESLDPDAQLLRAVILTNCGKVAEAERLCHLVLSGDELNAEARYLLALCREHAGEYAAAIEQDCVAIYLDPRFAMPHLHLGLLRKRTGDNAGACRAFRDAITLLPGEDASRILLLGGGFSRDMLIRLCDAELRAGGDHP